jgi:ribosomal protein S17E
MKKEATTKKITIERLAIMMNNGFESLKKEVREIIQEETKIFKNQLDGFENKLEGTNKRIDDLAENRVKVAEHNKLKARVTLIEEKI